MNGDSPVPIIHAPVVVRVFRGDTMADDFERSLQQLGKALATGHALAIKLRQQSADAQQHAILLEQSMWSAVAAVKRLSGTTK